MNVIPFGDDQAHGRLGKSVIFERRRGKVYCKTYKIPKDPRSQAQLDRRTCFYKGTQAWNLLTQSEKDYYNGLAVGQSYTGYNLFLRQFLLSCSAEKVYVVDQNNDRVQTFDLDGNFIAAFLSSGSDNGDIDSPRNIWVNDDRIYIADGDNWRGDVFSKDFTYITKFENRGLGPEQFRRINAIKIDSTGQIFAVIGSENKIIRFDSDYNFINEYTTFDSPHSLEIDSNDLIYTASASLRKIYVFNNDLTVNNTWGITGTNPGEFTRPQGLALDSNEDIYVTDGYANNVQKFSKTGAYYYGWGTLGTGDGQFDQPRQCCVDSNNNVYVSDRNNNRIQKFDSLGNFISKWGTLGTGDGEFDEPYGIYIF